MKRITTILIVALSASSSQAITYNVNDAAGFNAFDGQTLNAGDEIILASGNYGALIANINSSISDDATAQSTPIRIYAETAGGVNVTAPSKIDLDGRGIILAGLNFTSTSGMIDNGSSSPTDIINLDTHSRYITLNNIKFDHCAEGDDYGHWIQVRGFNHTIEYCSFEGKDEPNRNAIVAFKRNTSEAGITTPRNHVLRYCYFGPREASETANGYEAIRIGDSSSQAYDMRVVIEHNVFYRAIWRTDGEKANETEIISSKSKGSIIRNNTFLESFGQITLRHGDGATVEGNFIYGGGFYNNGTIELNAANSYQAGIRIIGQDHVVQNNYLINLQGDNLRAALCLMAGDGNFDDGDGTYGGNTYEPAHNTLIANNTFIDCKEINLGYETGSPNLTYPTGVEIYNNVWQGNGSNEAVVRDSGFIPSTSAGNYIYEPDSNDYGWTGLSNSTYSDTNSPAITQSYNHFLIPTSSSPLVNAANNAHTVTKDIRGLNRPGSGQDIGCFERGPSGAEYSPLLRNEVGPLFDGGPSNTYPANTITTNPISSTATASADDGNAPDNTLDNDLGTRWSANSDGLPNGQWIQFDMGDFYAVHSLHIAWYNGDVRTTNFDLEISDDGTNWRPLLTDQDSSGTTEQLEPLTIPVSHGRYLRIVGYGYTSNDGNTSAGWNSITEVAINGLLAPTITAEELSAPSSAKNGKSMSFTLDSIYGRRYQLQYTPNLLPPNWQNIGSVEIGTGSSIILTDPDTDTDTQRFYRIEIKP